MKKIFTHLFLLTISFQSFSQCWTQVAAGEFHTVAIKSDGTLWAWGLNDKGQLGDGTTINKNVPTQVGTDTDWAIINSSWNNNLAIKNDGSLWAWGDNAGGQNGNGNNGVGMIDVVPTRVGMDNDWATTAGAVFAIKNNGTLWGWGANSSGRLGTGDMLDHFTPVQIGIENNWVAVSGAANQTLAVKTDHTLWGWGLNKNGSLAIGAVNNFVLVPTQTGNNTADWEKVKVGGCCSSKMIKTDGSLWAMGIGVWGNLGNGTTVDVNNPIQIGTSSDWNIVSTTNSSCAIKDNGSLWTWGYNYAGQLGNGNSINSTIPIQIEGQFWQEVITGFNYAVGISIDGSLYSWGWNNYGQLGDGTFTDKNIPTQIGSICVLNTTDFNLINALKVVPNPTSDFLNLEFNSIENTSVTITLLSISGQVTYSESIKTTVGMNKNQINLSAYDSGMYLLTLKTATQSVTAKVIKQ